MIRRCPAPLTMMVAALAISLGSRPMSTQADTVTLTATYTLTSSSRPSGPERQYRGAAGRGAGLTSGRRGSSRVQQRRQESPLTILSGSSGFDAEPTGGCPQEHDQFHRAARADVRPGLLRPGAGGRRRAQLLADHREFPEYPACAPSQTSASLSPSTRCPHPRPAPARLGNAE